MVSDVELVPEDAPTKINCMPSGLLQHNLGLIWDLFHLDQVNSERGRERLALALAGHLAASDVVMTMALQTQRCGKQIQEEREGMVRVH